MRGVYDSEHAALEARLARRLADARAPGSLAGEHAEDPARIRVPAVAACAAHGEDAADELDARELSLTGAWQSGHSISASLNIVETTSRP